MIILSHESVFRGLTKVKIKKKEEDSAARCNITYNWSERRKKTRDLERPSYIPRRGDDATSSTLYLVYCIIHSIPFDTDSVRLGPSTWSWRLSGWWSLPKYQSFFFLNPVFSHSEPVKNLFIFSSDLPPELYDIWTPLPVEWLFIFRSFR